jgi:translation elongation factor EF-Ts
VFVTQNALRSGDEDMYRAENRLRRRRLCEPMVGEGRVAAGGVVTVEAACGGWRRRER